MTANSGVCAAITRFYWIDRLSDDPARDEPRRAESNQRRSNEDVPREFARHLERFRTSKPFKRLQALSSPPRKRRQVTLRPTISRRAKKLEHDTKMTRLGVRV